MTFPLAGDLPDPWIDGENPNAAAMKVRVTDKLNLLAAALGIKTARVAARFTRAAAQATTTGVVTDVPLTAIASSTGGTFAIVSGGIQFPAAGIYMFRARGAWGALLTARAFMEAYSPTDTLVRQPTGTGEDTMAYVGVVTIVTPATDILKFRAFQGSGSAQNFNSTIIDIVKVSE